MNILVTGGAGYVGSRVVALLVAQGNRVRVLDRLLYGGETLLALGPFPNLELAIGDIRKKDDLLAAMAGMDCVIHLAAIVGEAACNTNTALSWQTNHGSVQTLVEATREAGIERLLFISTCSNYGISEPNSAVNEDAPLNPLSDYARAKVVAEQAVLGDAVIPVTTVLRLGTICGIGARMRFDLLVNEMARDTVKDREIEIYAPLAWRPYLHIDDAAEAMWRVLQTDPDGVNRKVYNVVGENLQKTHLLDIAKRLKPTVKSTIVNRNPDLRDYRVSGERFEKALGFKPSRTIETAFREVAAAVADGRYRDSYWIGHSAVPLTSFPD